MINLCQNPLILKLSVLLAKYFYQHKELSLPGIGVFHLDAAVTVPDVNDKNFREFLKYIQFTQKPITKPDEALIDYIRAQTGKIKPLAESDLESYLADGKLLLNIGKPFTIEGIGSLQKFKSGDYQFTPGEPMLERLETIQEDRSHDKHQRHKPTYDESQVRHTVHNNQRKILLLGTLVIIGHAVILWGGYTLDNKKSGDDLPQPGTQKESTIQNIDSPVANTTTVDSNAIVQQSTQETVATTPPGSYKFVFENTNRKVRAIKRYAFVKERSPRIQMETRDSVWFTIYVTLPATPADTSRLKDSLHAWYYGQKPIKVTIAQ